MGGGETRPLRHFAYGNDVPKTFEKFQNITLMTFIQKWQLMLSHSTLAYKSISGYLGSVLFWGLGHQTLNMIARYIRPVPSKI